MLIFPVIAVAQTLINTSFESADNYTTGTINGKNKWTVSSGNGEIVGTTDYIKEGSQALKLSATSGALQIDNISYASNSTALSGDVYVDFWIKLKTIPTASFAITGYDLGTSTHRSFMLEFLSTGKIKIYDGTSGWSTSPTYNTDTWTRISTKIDNSSGTYQLAINGILYDKTFTFREIKNNATSFDFHSIRFSMSSGTCDVALENIYIGSSPISDIAFQASSTKRTITVTQPAYGTITLTPAKDTYELNEQVSVSISVPEHYVFGGWSGSLSGTTNPQTFTVTGNMTIGATVSVDTQNPPAQSVVTINQPIGATITLSPQQTTYYNGTTVQAQLNIQSGYQFNSWTGDLTGTTNPQTFVINNNMTIGANISEIQVNPTKRVVSTVSQFKDALSAMNPGDTICVLDGDYALGSVKLTRGGSALKPILIKSANLHGAKISGSSAFTLSSISYVTIEGFNIDVEPMSTIFKMEGCSYVRITRNWLKMKTLTDTQTSKWITVGDFWDNEVCNSHHNRFDHNLFDGKYDSGAWMIIDGSHGTVPAISQNDRIDHNIFRNNTPRMANEKETVRIGVSDLCKLDAFTVVEYNLFEDCDGDPEIVSVKSCKDTVRYNTFRRCVGTVCLRQGNNSVVNNNFFFGDEKTTTYDSNTIGCGGVRVYGLNHKIYNNYFEGLTGYKWDAACTLTNGDVTNSSTSNSSHFLPENITFAFNTLVNNKSDIEIGFDNSSAYGLAPKNNIISNNIIINSENPIIKSYSTTSLAGVTFSNNIAYPTGSSTLGISGTTENQIKIINPNLIKTVNRTPDNTQFESGFELYKLASSSPAINNGNGNFIPAFDMDGQSLTGIRDIGADEYNYDNAVLFGPTSDQFAGPTAPENYQYEQQVITSINNQKITSVSCFPNPFKANTTISIAENNRINNIFLFDVLGKNIDTKNYTVHISENKIDLSTSFKGLIICKIITDQYEKEFTIISE